MAHCQPMGIPTLAHKGMLIAGNIRGGIFPAITF
jgi:hypothetical protein